MFHEEFLAAIREAPEDPFQRAVFADWLDEQGHPIAAARLRWWNEVRPRLRCAIHLPEDSPEPGPGSDYITPGQALLSVDNWRWRLGCLVAIEAVERQFTPDLSPVPWRRGSPAAFQFHVQHSRFLIEMVALGAYLEHQAGVLELARTHAQNALGLAEGLKSTAAELGREGLLAWVDACEVQDLARRTLTVATTWSAWEVLLPGEGAMAGDLMVASKQALDCLLAEPVPAACLRD